MKINKEFWKTVKLSWIKELDSKKMLEIDEITSIIKHRHDSCQSSIKPALAILKSAICEEDDEWDDW